MAKITLWTEAGESETFTSNQEKIDSSFNFEEAQASSGLWILYADEDYHPYCPTAPTVQLLEPHTKVKLDFAPRSMRVISQSVPSITVFATTYYGGGSKIKTYFSSADDITDVFPDGDCGASSFIVINSEWYLYQKVNFDGPHRTFGPGKYPEVDGYNDLTKSLRMVSQ